MPIPEHSKTTTEFLVKIGLDAHRPLAKDCADFYLIEWLIAQEYRGAESMMQRIERPLCREITTYLDLATGGEARHIGSRAVNSGEIIVPDVLSDYMAKSAAVEWSRGKTWRIWMQEYTLRQRLPMIHAASETFAREEWHDKSAGGPGWAAIGKVVHDYLSGNMSDRVFLDRCWTLQHNNGFVFDKVYDVERLNRALEIQAEGDYDKLAQVASPIVGRIWERWRHSLAEDHDPTWYGVQRIIREGDGDGE